MTASEKLDARLREIAKATPTRMPYYRAEVSDDGRAGELVYVYADGREKVVLAVVSD